MKCLPRAFCYVSNGWTGIEMKKRIGKANLVGFEKSSACMLAGIGDGLSSFVKLWAAARVSRARRYPRRGIESDWADVGKDLHAALASWRSDEAA
jgi:hypothetical protein